MQIKWTDVPNQGHISHTELIKRDGKVKSLVKSFGLTSAAAKQNNSFLQNLYVNIFLTLDLSSQIAKVKKDF